MIAGKQLIILILDVALTAIVVAAFAWIVASTRHPKEFKAVQPGGYKLRRRWGWFYGALITAAFGITFWTVPYAWAQPAQSASRALEVHIVAHQFSFTMPARLPAGRLIKFVVTSSDVNHGVGIYDPEGRLLGQVQAMPDYSNVYYFTFSKPGRYVIRCMEYCGIGHSDMYQTLYVYRSKSGLTGALQREG